MQNHIRTMSAP